MREILFRGKDADAGEWVYGYYSGPVGACECHEICNINDVLGSMVDVDPETVGQYTGFTDRNGKKIFEGDIVERFHRFGNEIERMYVVEHKGSWCLWDFDDNDDFLSNWCAPAYFHGEQVGGCIVIGNMHDNPELIGGTE